MPLCTPRNIWRPAERSAPTATRREQLNTELLRAWGGG